MNIKLFLLSIVFGITSFIPVNAQNKKTSTVIKALKITSHMVEITTALYFIKNLFDKRHLKHCSNGCLGCKIIKPIAAPLVSITLLINGLRGLKNELYPEKIIVN